MKPRLCGKLFSDNHGQNIETKINAENYFQKNLAKFKRGKHGAGLDDIDIEELDWVRDRMTPYHCQSYSNVLFEALYEYLI